MDKMTIQTLVSKKADGRKIAARGARLPVRQSSPRTAQVDCVLVGDPIGMTVFGFESLVEDARVLEESGICMLVLEAVPADLEGRCGSCAS
jgi:ketopantoate hydroxymethyltransferase